MRYKSLASVKKDVKKDYVKRVIFDISELPKGGHVVQEVTIPPQTKQRAHYHHKQTEIFYIFSGECLIYINNAKFLAKPGDAFVCEPGETHFLWNKSVKPFGLLVFKINKLLDNDDTTWQD